MPRRWTWGPARRSRSRRWSGWARAARSCTTGAPRPWMIGSNPACGGGDKHGQTSVLTPDELSDFLASSRNSVRARSRFRRELATQPPRLPGATSVSRMPLIQVFTSVSPPAAEGAAALLADLSRLAAQQFGKPERWVMTCLVPGLTMTFGGSPGPAAFVAVKNIGTMTPDQTATLSKEICGRLEGALKNPRRSRLHRFPGRGRLPVGMERRHLRLTCRPA